MKKLASGVCGAVLVALAVGFEWPQKAEAVSMQLTSMAFQEGQKIPFRYTCDGENVSPPLEWVGAPGGAKSFALVSQDPDAPGGTWVHWLVWNIPSSEQGLPEAVPTKRTLPNGIHQGTSSFGEIGYGGPCPPSGTHRYFFALSALDITLDLPAGATQVQFDAAIKGHVLAQASLMGTYRRK